MTELLTTLFQHIDSGATIATIAVFATLATRALKASAPVWSKLPKTSRKYVPIALAFFGTLATVEMYEDWRVAAATVVIETLTAGASALGLYHFVKGERDA